MICQAAQAFADLNIQNDDACFGMIVLIYMKAACKER